MKRVLLTGARAPVTLDLARHFHRTNHEVYLADSIRWPIASLTRTAKKTFLVAPPASHPDQFVADLIRIATQYQIDLIIPTCEEIFYVASRLDAWQGISNVFADSMEKLAALHNKWEFSNRIMKQAQVALTPETHLLSDADAVQPWSTRHDLDDWVFKPVFSRFAARTLISPTQQAMATMVPSATDPWLAQRRIRGREFSTYSVARSGNLTAHACYYSPYRAGPGSGIYFVNVQDDRILDFVRKLVAQLDYTGQIGFDLIVDPFDRLYVLECNPRATSGLHLLRSTRLSDAFTGNAKQTIAPTLHQPAMLMSIMMMYAVPQVLREGGWGTLFRDMWKAKDIFWDWTDPAPACLAPISLIEVGMRAWKTGKALTRAATFDIEWNGEPL